MDGKGVKPRTLRKQERKIKNVPLRQRVMAVRLVMEGYQRRRGHAQPTPAKCRFLCVLIQGRWAGSPARSEISAGPETILDAGIVAGTERTGVDPHPSRTRLRHCFILEYADSSIVYPRALRGDYVPGRDSETLPSNETVLDSADRYFGPRR